MAEFMCQICGKPLETLEEIEMGAHEGCMDDEGTAILWSEDIPPNVEDL
ncbi:MAG: hypothetical protein JSW06_01525 [Thermoplasmatales archaeon]|nr:MAG: hypothetical protein JSW06_01525 [Thermoplasmatales archaeon]